MLLEGIWGGPCLHIKVNTWTESCINDPGDAGTSVATLMKDGKHRVLLDLLPADGLQV